ncbi:MAG TPA: BamA/TamA family outer membrane protein [Planctomycetota bacterium]|jgi:outer membrane protein assembly factor BamA|nr:BamA/TamA family outer membrane protein [Planctomycetota bacterium]
MTGGLLALAAAVLLGAGGAVQETVLEVQVEGNRTTPTKVILDLLGTRPGRALDRRELERDLRELWTRLRIRAEVEEEAVPGGLRIHLRVEEAPKLREIEFRGNRAFGREKLLEAGEIVPGSPLDEISLARVRAAVERFHREEGYLFAEVSTRIDREAERAVFEVSEGPLVRVAEVRIVGNRAFPTGSFLGIGKSLRGAMQLRGAWFLFRGSEFKERVLREDLIAIRRLYRAEGYRDAVVEVRDLHFSEDRTEVTVELLVEEGPRYVVASVAIEGNRAFPREELEPLLRLKPGMPLTYEAVRGDLFALTRFYGERGYPRHPSIRDGFRIDEPEELYGEETARVALTYRIREGERTRLRAIEILGNTSTLDPVIRRELTVFPGDWVNTTELTRSIAQLDGLRYFTDEAGLPATSYRYVETGESGWKDLRIEVQEGQTGNFLFGGGVSSVDGAFVSVSLLKRNADLFALPSSLGSALSEIVEGKAFHGGGQDVQLELAPGTRLSLYRLHFHEPDLFGDHVERTSLTLDLYKRLRGFGGLYGEARQGLLAAFGRNFTRQTALEVGLKSEQVDVTNVDPAAPKPLFEQEELGLSGLRSAYVDFVHSRLDIPVDPTEGYLVRARYEHAGGPIGGDFDFRKVFLTGRGYVRVAEDERGRARVLSGVVRLAWAEGFGETETVPYTERLFAGGPGTIRGFDFRGVGPKFNGEPYGGEAMYLGSAEYRFPVYSTAVSGRLEEVELVRGRLFLDAGTLRKHFRNSFEEWRAAGGVGVLIRLPIAPQLPITLDFGVPLHRERTDDTQVFTFSIGNFF